MSKNEKYVSTLALCTAVIVISLASQGMWLGVKVSMISISLIVVIVSSVKQSIK